MLSISVLNNVLIELNLRLKMGHVLFSNTTALVENNNFFIVYELLRR